MFMCTYLTWFSYVPGRAVTPEVKKKVDELLAGVTDEERQIEILTHWVADEVRYTGISMGWGEGYTLHKGEMTFPDRCGVCKDKAGMLVTMLRAAGFESYAAMTMAGSRIDYIPADQFNHSVTVVKRRTASTTCSIPPGCPSSASCGPRGAAAELPDGPAGNRRPHVHAVEPSGKTFHQREFGLFS